MFIIDATLCDGANWQAITDTQCTVLLSELKEIPFQLRLGYEIKIKVVAYNAYGVSEMSPVGNGGIMVYVPDAPVNLQNNPLVTSDSIIEFTWEDGASDGNRPIIDWRVTYDESTGNFVTLVDGLTDRVYTTDFTLLKGQTYTFYVQARNDVGYSAPSEQIPILVAQIPDKPDAPVTSIVGDTVQIDWPTPYDGSSPITSYIITIRHNDDVTYSEEIVNCNG